MNLDTNEENTWCPGCGNFGILAAFKNAVKELVEEGELKYENVVISSGIGCHAKIVDYVNVNSFYSIHGRVSPTIIGMKIVNPELKVIGFSGDGDSYAEGISHLIHAAKNNADINMIIHDNQVFALTTGQFTPTTPKGLKTKTSPEGSYEDPINPLALMLISGATFVARGFSGDVNHLKELIKTSIKHKGFSLIDVLQPCVSFNDTNEFFKQRVYDLNQKDHDIKDFKSALEKTYEWGDKIPMGIFYQIEKKTFGELLGKGSKKSSISDILKEHI